MEGHPAICDKHLNQIYWMGIDVNWWWMLHEIEVDEMCVGLTHMSPAIWHSMCAMCEVESIGHSDETHRANEASWEMAVAGSHHKSY